MQTKTVRNVPSAGGRNALETFLYIRRVENIKPGLYRFLPLEHKLVLVSDSEDTEKNMIKVSLRSVGTFPCNKVASEFFNGGGHLNASGGEFYGTMDEAIELFKQALVKYEDLLNK